MAHLTRKGFEALLQKLTSSDPMGSLKASLLLLISSLGIQKTILLLHKNARLVKNVQWYDVTSLMPGLRKR